MVSSRATAPTPSPLIPPTPRAAARLEGTASRLMALHMDNSLQPVVRFLKVLMLLSDLFCARSMLLVHQGNM